MVILQNRNKILDFGDGIDRCLRVLVHLTELRATFVVRSNRPGQNT